MMKASLTSMNSILWFWTQPLRLISSSLPDFCPPNPQSELTLWSSRSLTGICARRRKSFWTQTTGSNFENRFSWSIKMTGLGSYEVLDCSVMLTTSRKKEWDPRNKFWKSFLIWDEVQRLTSKGIRRIDQRLLFRDFQSFLLIRKSQSRNRWSLVQKLIDRLNASIRVSSIWYHKKDQKQIHQILSLKFLHWKSRAKLGKN